MPLPAPVPYSDVEEAALADHWLVILGSKRDPAEPIPGLETLAAHPELGLHPRTLASGRFKNLMPCYTVTVAAAPGDKAEALAVAAKLRAVGVDHYVKAAGAWVGPSPRLDAWCAAPPTVEAGEVRVAVAVDGSAWLYDGAADGAVASALDAAAKPKPLGTDYAAWYQPAPDAAGPPAPWLLVDPATGATQTCTTAGRAQLTLGTPHFGALQGPTPPSDPVCGSPLLYSRLACPSAAGSGAWVALPAGTKVEVFRPAGDAPAAVEAATAALRAETGWGAAGESNPEDVQRDVTVQRWKGPRGELLLVQGRRIEDGGLCGGDDRTWAAVYQATPRGLGPRLVGWTELSVGGVRGLVDIGADGTPELVVDQFPTTTTVLDADGSPIAEHSTGYCDCPC